MYACDPAVKSIPLAPAEIREFGQSEDFVQYSITGITPNAAGQCKIGFEIKADPYAVTVLDDVSFAAEGEGGVNLAPNPGFEDITPMNYASGGIISRNTMKYGYMETRAKGAPALPGACSAIWLLGRTDDWGTEIDVLEIGQTSTVNELDFAVHTFKTRDSVKTPRQDVNPHGSAGIWGNRNSFNPSEAYHVYGLEWGPGYQKFYVDGTLMGEFYGSTKAPESGGPAAQWQTSSTGHANNMNAIPQSLLLSLGLRPPYRDGNDPSLNTTFDVDYIRVWRADNQEAKGDIREVVTNEGNLVVPYGTSEAELLARLPATVPVLVGTPAQKLSLLNQRDVPVNWEVSGFSGEAAGVTTVLRGTLGELPQGVANPAGLAASLNIYVQNGERGVDKTALQALADRPYTEAEYTATSWNSYLAARAAARAVLADEEATAGEVLAAYEALNEAIKALKPAPNLDALLARRLDAGKYTAPTWWEYTTARSAAQAVQAGGSAAGETEAAYERLWTAIQQLEELPEGENVLQGKMPAADVSVQNAAAATDGVIPDTGWGPDTDKTVYTTLLAGAEGGADNGYAGWPGAYLEYDLGEEQPIQRLEIYRSWYATDLRSVTWKDCRVELCATPDFAPEATVSAGPADYVLNSDTDVSQLGRRQPQIVELEQPARARYIRVYGRGHLGGWGNYSARMSYGEIRALKAPAPQWDKLNGLVAQARQAAGGELDPEPAGRLQAALDAAQALPADADAAAVNEAYALLKTALKAAGNAGKPCGPRGSTAGGRIPAQQLGGVCPGAGHGPGGAGEAGGAGRGAGGPARGNGCAGTGRKRSAGLASRFGRGDRKPRGHHGRQRRGGRMECRLGQERLHHDFCRAGGRRGKWLWKLARGVSAIRPRAGEKYCGAGDPSLVVCGGSAAGHLEGLHDPAFDRGGLCTGAHRYRRPRGPGLAGRYRGGGYGPRRSAAGAPGCPGGGPLYTGVRQGAPGRLGKLQRPHELCRDPGLFNGLRR